MMETPKRKESAKTILNRHKNKVIEMWNACYSVREIHRFLLEQGENISYHQLRRVCISYLNFDTKRKGEFLKT